MTSNYQRGDERRGEDLFLFIFSTPVISQRLGPALSLSSRLPERMKKQLLEQHATQQMAHRLQTLQSECCSSVSLV